MYRYGDLEESGAHGKFKLMKSNWHSLGPAPHPDDQIIPRTPTLIGKILDPRVTASISKHSLAYVPARIFEVMFIYFLLQYPHKNEHHKLVIDWKQQTSTFERTRAEEIYFWYVVKWIFFAYSWIQYIDFIYPIELP